MENHKDLILQAFSFGVKSIQISPNQGLYLDFPEFTIPLFLSRLDKLGINYNYNNIAGHNETIEIKAI